MSAEEPRARERCAGCANGRRPEYSSPQPAQLTENDMSDSCVRDPQLAEQPPEQRVVALVVDEEARVERQAVVDDGVRVPARAAVALEHVHVVRPRQDVRRAEPGDPAADDRDPHQPLFARAANTG